MNTDLDSTRGNAESKFVVYHIPPEIASHLRQGYTPTA